MEDQVNISVPCEEQEQDVNQVSFKEIESTYYVDFNIHVHYSISGDLEVNSRDWIALYKVGWKSHYDFVYYDWSPYPAGYVAGMEISNSVVIPKSKLPKEDNELYQFCYITSEGLLKGSSDSFSFKEYSVDDLYEVEEDGVMVVNTKKTLDFQLKMANKQIKQLKEEYEEADKRLISLRRRNEQMQDDLDNYYLSDSKLKMELAEVKSDYEREVGNARLMKISLKSFERELLFCRESLRKMTNELSQENNEHKTTKESLVCITRELNLSENELAEVKKELSDERRIREDVEQLLEMEKNKTSDLEETYRRAYDKMMSYILYRNVEHNELIISNSMLKKEKEEKENSITIIEEELKKKIANLEMENAAFAGQIKKHSSENVRLEEDNKEAEERVNYWFGKYKKFMNECLRLKTHLYDFEIYKNNERAYHKEIFDSYPILFSDL